LVGVDGEVTLKTPVELELKKGAWSTFFPRWVVLWEREVWMNVESPLGRAKRIFWAEMIDTVL